MQRIFQKIMSRIQAASQDVVMAFRGPGTESQYLTAFYNSGCLTALRQRVPTSNVRPNCALLHIRMQICCQT